MGGRLIRVQNKGLWLILRKHKALDGGAIGEGMGQKGMAGAGAKEGGNIPLCQVFQQQKKLSMTWGGSES